MKRTSFLLVSLTCFAAAAAFAAEPPVKVLIIGGQNNHDWKATTPYLKSILDKAGRFQTTVHDTPDKDAPQAPWDAWRPKFRDYQCVLLNYNGRMWPEPVKRDFVEYVRGGGGVVVIHAANNPFGGWNEYEQMVGLLWRWWTYGSSLYVDDAGQVVREEPGQGRPMGHGVDVGMQCVGFKVLLLRSCEWAATGRCSTPVPPSFPTAEKTSVDP